MNLKKIFAALAATAVAATMAISACADTYDASYKLSATADKVNNNTTTDPGFYTQIQVGHVPEITVTIKYTVDGGDSGYALIATNWGGDAAVEANAVKMTGAWGGANVLLPDEVMTEDVDYSKITFEVTAEVTDIDGYVKTVVDGAKEGDDVDKAIADTQIFRFGGNVDYANGDGTVKIAVNKASGTSSTTSSTTSSSKTNSTPKTGATSGLALAGLALAGAAIVATKKSK